MQFSKLALVAALAAIVNATPRQDAGPRPNPRPYPPQPGPPPTRPLPNPPPQSDAGGGGGGGRSRRGGGSSYSRRSVDEVAEHLNLLARDLDYLVARDAAEYEPFLDARDAFELDFEDYY